MRRSLFAWLLWMTGCLNPDDRLGLTGSVRSVEPPSGQVVRLLRARGAPPWNVCDPATAQPFRTTTVDEDGGFRFDLFRVEAQALTGTQQFCFRVETEFASGSRAVTDLRYMNQPTRVATLPEWRTQLELDAGVLQFTPVVPWPDEALQIDDAGRPRLGVQLSHRAELRTLDGGVIWRADDRLPVRDGGLFGYRRTELALSDFALEDFAGRLHLLALLDEGETRLEGIYEARLPGVVLTADQLLSLNGRLTPLSRGLPCPEFGAPCPLTDGQLELFDAGLRPVISLDLGAMRSVQAVVLRGVDLAGTSIELRLEQDDGGLAHEQTLTLGRSSLDDQSIPRQVVLPDGGYRVLSKTYSVLRVAGPVEARQVVLRFDDGLVAAEEISVF